MNSVLSRSQNHEVAEDGRDPCKSPGPCPLFKQGFLKTVWQDGFWKSLRTKTPQPPRATCASAQSHSQWKSVFWCSGRAFCISSCAPCLWSCHGAALKRPWWSFLYRPFCYLQIFVRPPETSTSWTVPALSAFPQRRDAAFCHLSGLYWTLLGACTRAPKIGQSTLGRASPMLRKRQISHPLTCWQHSSWCSLRYHQPFLLPGSIIGIWGPFLQSCFQGGCHPGHTSSWGCCLAGLFASPFWTSWDSCQPSGWLHSPLTNQPLLTFVSSANLSHHPDNFMLMFWVTFFHCQISFPLSVHLFLALLCSQQQELFLWAPSNSGNVGWYEYSDTKVNLSLCHEKQKILSGKFNLGHTAMAKKDVTERQS